MHSGTTQRLRTPGSAVNSLPRRRALIIALLVLVALIAGVSIWRLTAFQKIPGPAVSDYASGLSELGATQVQWNAQHMADPGTTSAAFLPRNLDGRDRFINVGFDHGRVSGFIMQFDANTVDETAAKVTVREELPPDARLVFESLKYLGTTDIDEQCDQLQYQSAVIGTLFAQDRGGIVSVVIWSPDPKGLLRKYDPASITSINIMATGALSVIPNEC